MPSQITNLAKNGEFCALIKALDTFEINESYVYTVYTVHDMFANLCKEGHIFVNCKNFIYFLQHIIF